MADKPRLITKEDYDKFYANGGFGYDKSTTEKFMADVVKLPDLAFSSNEKLTLLDVGCGDGFLSDIFSKWFNVVGIDNSTVGIRIAKNKYPNIKFIESDVLSHNEKYDIVYNRACQISNCPTSSVNFIESTKHLVSLAKKHYFFSEWTREDFYNTYDGRWHYKNPLEVLTECLKHGKASMIYDKLICNFVVRIDF